MKRWRDLPRWMGQTLFVAGCTTAFRDTKNDTDARHCEISGSHRAKFSSWRTCVLLFRWQTCTLTNSYRDSDKIFQLSLSVWPTRGLRSLRPLVCWDCGFESRRGARMYLVSVVWCQVDVCASVWSLVQRSRTECGVSECDREAWPWFPRDWHAMEKKISASIIQVSLNKNQMRLKHGQCHPTNMGAVSDKTACAIVHPMWE